ncbi:MAG: hypothetical protein NC489_17705 [Ruminococcus flavefaciens]|nr:hypothetical protein [Ruminococcus flavefaciens]
MFHLRLTKAMSYAGCGLSATKKNPDVFTEDKAQAEALTNSGYFQLVEGTGELQTPEQQPGEDTGENADDSIPDGILSEPDENAGDGKDEPQGKTLDQMSRAELETFATYKNVSVKGLPNKPAIVAKLREVLSPEETSGIIEYGSPTMTELQQ